MRSLRTILAWSILLALLATPLRAEQGVQLIDAADPMAGWKFGNGAEFPGATGGLTADPAMQRDGRPSLRLHADLSGGGNYVDMGRDVAARKLDIESVSFWLKAPGIDGLTMRLIDGGGRCHQIRLKLDPPSDDWRLVSFPVRRFFDKRGTAEAVQGVAQYESWGGAKGQGDGWTGDLKSFVLLTGKRGAVIDMWVSGVVVGVRAGTIGWECGFEDGTALQTGWTVEGGAKVASGATAAAFAGRNALVLERAAEQREQPCSASSPVFPVAPGVWEISAALSPALESPDASYCGSLRFQALDATGKVLDESEIATPFGSNPWQVVRKQVRTAARTAGGRLVLRLNKTIGALRVDALSAKPLSTPKPVPAVERIVLASTALGNLLLPEAPRTWTVEVQSARALKDEELALQWSVRDYWGAEIAPAATATLSGNGTVKERKRYAAAIDLAGLPLEVGRYYELHAAVPLAGEDPFRNSAGFAIVPTAASKAFTPAQIPFTSRNWDNRLGEYIRLSDRLGFRIIGLWGGADATPPYKAGAPGIALCAELGAAVLTGCPARLNDIEYHRQGWERWTDEATIRGAVASWFAAYGAHQPKPLVVNLGNEPHGTGEQVKQQVAAYKIAYDEIKKRAPDCIVVATSVPATEEYFQAGYQDACDAFDFHVYERPEDVRRAIGNYQALMKKYDCVKPVWSTEIGLNSQGLTRQHIAGDMVRKFATFFAAGGANMNWFDLLYPDPEGKALGTSGDSFNMFDSRYTAYAARLDAVMCYHLINGILDKRFIIEREWDGGLHGTLFRDAAGACFVALWQDAAAGTKPVRADVQLALPGVAEVQVTRIDGRRSVLRCADGGIGLGIGADPLLLTFAGPKDQATLPERLTPAALRVVAAPERLMRGTPGVVEVATTADPQRVALLAPAGWSVERDPATPLRFTVTSPEASTAREGDLLLRLADADGKPTVELGARPVLTGRLSLEVRGRPATGGGKPQVELVLANQSSSPQTVTWAVALTGERAPLNGAYSAPAATSAYLGDAGNGSVTLAPASQQVIAVPLAGIVAGRLYQATASLTDATGGMIAADQDLRDLAP